VPFHIHYTGKGKEGGGNDIEANSTSACKEGICPSGILNIFGFPFICVFDTLYCRLFVTAESVSLI